MLPSKSSISSEFIRTKGVKHDPIGFDMRCAGRHGQAFGIGLYFGLSNQATIGSNALSGLPWTRPYLATSRRRIRLPTSGPPSPW